MSLLKAIALIGLFATPVLADTTKSRAPTTDKSKTTPPPPPNPPMQKAPEGSAPGATKKPLPAGNGSGSATK